MSRIHFLLAAGWFCAATAQADPIITSWFTVNSGLYARVTQTNGATAQTTWPSAGVANNNTGSASQTLPAYSDVQRVCYSASNVYINASGLASYIMGPWYGSAAQNNPWGFWPLSQNYTVSITRTPSPATTPKPAHMGGPVGLMVNGVVIYDLGDAFSFKQTNATPATSTTAGGTDSTQGDGWWYRDALAVEVVTFDTGFAHQPGNNGQYHYHAEPKALRYQLGDNMNATYNSTNKTYTYLEATNNTNLRHSPILGWSFDGYPIYGPYGYSNRTNAASAVSRMRSGFVLRNGQNGTTDVTATGRTTLPKWAAAAQNYPNPGNVNPVTLSPTNYGPATTYTSVNGPNTTLYSLGRYSADYDYLGDLTNSGTHAYYQQGTDFDLDQYNGRNCVTPDFPGGTYAYFVSIDSAGNPAFPYMLAKQYYGIKNGSAQGVTIPPTGITNYFLGGTNLQEVLKAPAVNSSSGTVTLTWSSIEGGSYVLLSKTNLASANWTTNTLLSAATNTLLTTALDAGAARTNATLFYRILRTGVAPFKQ